MLRTLKEVIGLREQRESLQPWLDLDEDERNRVLAWKSLVEIGKGTGKYPLITFWSPAQIAALSTGNLKFDDPIEAFSLELDDSGLPYFDFKKTYDRLGNKHWQAVLLAFYDLREILKDNLPNLPSEVVEEMYKVDRKLERHTQ